LAKVANEESIEYVSVINELCNSEGCISRVGGAPQDFIAIDYGHFSKNGSEFLIEKFKKIILYDLGILQKIQINGDRN